ncbi:MAG: hypothetical protein KAU10_02640 [Dehalococcoidia bacterium]|nr:hypothetical protein [Dehalococcoidia bacterium]
MATASVQGVAGVVVWAVAEVGAQVVVVVEDLGAVGAGERHIGSPDAKCKDLLSLKGNAGGDLNA